MHKVRSRLRDAEMPWKLSSEALKRTANLHSYTISSALDEIKPHESLLGEKPDNSQFRIFRCTTYVQVTVEARSSKFDDHAWIGVHLADANGLYCDHILNTKNLVHWKNVTYDEDKFPLSCCNINVPSCNELEVFEDND